MRRSEIARTLAVAAAFSAMATWSSARAANSERAPTSGPPISAQFAPSIDGSWADESPPASRTLPTAIYDPVRDRMVVFGGFAGGANGSGYLNDVWTLSLGDAPLWTPLAPSGTPPLGRIGHSAVYDQLRDRIVVFGGVDNFGSHLNDVWALTLSTHPTWTQLTPSGTPPSRRGLDSAIYDAAHDRMVVFGGTDGYGFLNDVWILSLAGNTAWTTLTPVGALPNIRAGHTAIYDPLRERMVIFGGSCTSLLGDTWALSLAGTPAWTQLRPSGVVPGPRTGHSAIYDPVRDRMVIFGGADDRDVSNDVFALSLAGNHAWAQLTPAGPLPDGRYSQTTIFDPLRDRMLMFGGVLRGNGARVFNDVWALSLVGNPAWTQLARSVSAPSVRVAPTAIYDPVRNRMLVFGGYNGVTLFNDLWAMSLVGNPTWTQLSPAGTPPVGRFVHTAIYDPVGDRMIVFGGLSRTTDNLNDTWALSLTGSPTWSQLNPAGTPPSARLAHSAIYDPLRGRMIVFGGSDVGFLHDVWELSLGASPVWSQLIPAGTPPSARSGQSAIYDPQGDRMVIFGGDDGRFVNDVWALSLASSPSWSKLSPAGTPPSARYSHTAIYDPVRDRMVMFGGPTVDGGGSLNDTWALSLTGSPSWSQLAPVGSLPSARLGHSAIYDPVRDRMVVFAGYNGGYYNVYLNGVWDLRWTPGPPPPPGSDALTLDPAYPNPSRSDITVGFALPRAGAVTLRMYDVSGRIVRTLLDATLPPGPRTVHWDRRTSSGRLADPGVYFYELRVNGSRLAKRVVVLP